MSKPSKVLVIGSGPIIIGQAAEFDYAGTQACKALREEGVTSVLVNSNPATIMTDEGIADIVYIEPLTVEVLSRIIERERPDGLLATLGGQTGLNLAVDLDRAGVLDKYNVRSLGTPIQTIHKAEDRALFKALLQEIGEPVPESAVVTSLEEARNVARNLGLPLVIRPSYTLGGTGGGMARSQADFERLVVAGLSASPVHNVLIERSIEGWKELEYEVMRDGADNCITVCNMENIDPMGVHTGDSIVVAPSQTLTDKEYQMLRTASLRIIRALGVEGGCNIQFALPPHPVVAQRLPNEKHAERNASSPYYVIEVNPRVSRSSALASKATGYPIARVAAKIAVGKRLDEIPNAVTGKTLAAFEPALDYCVVKIPRWPFDKFPLGERSTGTQMKATGEVMAIDRSFEGAFQKAVRSLEIGRRSLLWEDPGWGLKETINLQSLPLDPHDQRLWVLFAALRRGAHPDDLSRRTGIDPWFINKFKNIVSMEQRLLSETLTPELLRAAKRTGFSDIHIAALADRLPEQVRELRKGWSIRPVYKTVDTCAAEFAAETPYFYSTYETENEAESLPDPKAVVIGSGPIRIGQGIEFDYCSVQAAWALQKENVSSIMVNSNPETVSTDFDTSDRLYFEPLDEEGVYDILENESNGTGARGAAPPPSTVQFGGQTAINLAGPLAHIGMPILGSNAEAIDQAENRSRFETLLAQMGIPMPPGGAVTSLEEALKVAQVIGYPVLVRPSYVLGGRAMEIVHSATELVQFIAPALEAAQGRPILIDKYLQGKEVEVDAVCDGQSVLIPGVMEHIERAGVHSGDAMAVYPPLTLAQQEIQTIVEYSTRLGLALGIRGLMNIQYVVMGNTNGNAPAVYVIEVNPRASRTVPFLSKITGVPMVDLATRVMLGKKIQDLGYREGLWPTSGAWGIKAPVFSMSKLAGVDTYLGPEMKSTGEVMGIDFTFESALAKALMAAGLMLSPKGALLLSIADRDKPEALPFIRKLANSGYRLYATQGTAAMLAAAGLAVTVVYKLQEGSPNSVDVIQQGKVNAVINTMTGGRTPLRDGFEIRRAAAEQRIPCFTSLDTAKAAIESLLRGLTTYNVRPRAEYLRRNGG